MSGSALSVIFKLCKTREGPDLVQYKHIEVVEEQAGWYCMLRFKKKKKNKVRVCKLKGVDGLWSEHVIESNVDLVFSCSRL